MPRRSASYISPKQPTGLVRSKFNLPDYITAKGNILQIDIGKLPLPKETYVANAGWTEKDGTTVSIFVANRDRNDTSRLKTRVELRFSQETFSNLWKNSREFHESLKELGNRVPSILEGTPGEDPAKLNSDKDHVASASIAIMTLSGTQGEIDFFSLPATDIFLSQRHDRLLEVIPVLRVSTTSGVLWNILQTAELIAKQIEPQVNSLLQLVQANAEGEL